MRPCPFAAPDRYLVRVNYHVVLNTKADDCDNIVLTTEPLTVEVVAPTEAEPVALTAVDEIGDSPLWPMRPYGWETGYPLRIINRVEAAWSALAGQDRLRSYVAFWLAARYLGAARCADALRVLEGRIGDRPNSIDLQVDYIKGECLIQTGKAKDGWAILDQLPAEYPEMELRAARKADAYHGGRLGYLRDQITKSLARPRPSPSPQPAVAGP